MNSSLNQLHFLALILLTLISCQYQNPKIIEKWDNGYPKKVNVFDKVKTFETNYYENGVIESEGVLVENKRESNWIFYHDNGKVKRKTFYKENIPYSNVENYYKSGMIESKGILNEKGLKSDIWEFYSENGNLKSKGEFTSGKKTNFWHSYYDNGSTERKEFYDSDGWIVTQIFYDNKGSIKRFQEYNEFHQLVKEEFTIDSLNNQILVRKFYDHGQVQFEGLINDGYEVGSWAFWYSNGRKRAQGKFANDILSLKNKKLIRADLEELIDIEIKSRGLKVGNWIYWDRNGNKILELEYQDSGSSIKEKVKFFNLSNMN